MTLANLPNYQIFFGFKKEMFSQTIKIEELYQTSALTAGAERFIYAVNLGAVSVITGEVGTGKSTSLRYAVNTLHPSQYRCLTIIASTGSYLEILRQICLSLEVENKSHSITLITKMIRTILLEIANKKQMPVLVIDEAHLLRLEVFAQLHTLGQFEMDSRPIMPMILCGQNNLIDKMMYHTSRPLAGRVVGRTYLQGLTLKEMEGYLLHHLEIAGISQQLFSDEAVLAVHQGSGGLLRRANILARGAIIAAAAEKCPVISPEHVRIATTEII